MSDVEILRLKPEQMTELILSGQMKPIGTPIRERPERRTGPTVELEKARQIFGGDFLGPEAVEKAFGIKLASTEVSNIPFSEDELLKAKNLGQMLLLRIGKWSNGTPVTMQSLTDKIQPEFDGGNKGKILYNTDWYQEENFYTTEAPKAGWALVSKEAVPNSTGKNYLQQTQVLSDLLMSGRVFGSQIPREYQEALAEFGSQKAELERQMSNQEYYNQHWPEIAEKLSNLSLNKLLRQAPVEVLYDLLLRFRNTNDERLLKNQYTWTYRRSSGGDLVSVGGFGAGGLGLSGRLPGGSGGGLGVCLSR